MECKFHKTSRGITCKKEQKGAGKGMNLLHSDITKNLDHIKQEFGNSPDIKFCKIEIGISLKITVVVMYIDGLVNKGAMDDWILQSLKDDLDETKIHDVCELYNRIKQDVLVVGELQSISRWDELCLSMLSGDTIILMDDWPEALSVNTRGGETRSITEPTSQVTIRGPKDCFTESIATNISLVRRRIKSSKLWLEITKVGSVTQTDIGILYIKDIASDKLVREIKQRLNSIEIDAILESGYIEELIQDETFTLFPTIYSTERPDSVVGNLLEGRVAILVDGTPFVLLSPTVFFQFFQSPEDYYQGFVISTFLRFLRFFSFLVCLLGTPVYIAALSFHQEMIPTSLLLSLAAQRDGAPFPLLIEALLMEVSFEVIREAGLRMPRALGQAVSIVGALILGQAAVQAGIISASMVIIVAASGIASFTIPSFSLATTRILRFPFMIVAGILGFYGVMLGTIMIIGHMSSLRSFGIPYLAPFAPWVSSDQKDTLFRFPLWSFFTRPRLISRQNRTRMARDLQSSPSQNMSKEDMDEK
ncbi:MULTISPECIES: spore germination protein [unclassified Bacillus cereus group]|uniref:spore germination protein n=1 Tax=unclassified Bacillus cereus group TaxID=2750818 RepID=UPI00339910CE